MKQHISYEAYEMFEQVPLKYLYFNNAFSQ